MQSGELDWQHVEDRIRDRRMTHIRLSKMRPPKTVGMVMEASSPETPIEIDTDMVFHGQSASPGIYDGVARVILDPSIDIELTPGEILVAPYTDPAWTPETQWDPEAFWYEMYQEVDGFDTPMVDGFGDPVMLNGVDEYDDVEQDIINIHPTNPNDIVTRYGMYLHQLSDEATYLVEDNVPMATNPDCSGQAACVGIERRKIKVAVVHCGDGTPPTQDVQGRDYINVKGKYLDVFLTEEVEDPNSNAAVYAEIIGDASGDSGGAQDEISNVRLVD